MFLARYNGTCPACEDQIDIGNEVTQVDTDQRRVVVHNRCAEDGVVTVEARIGRVDHTTTVPRGKTARDACGRCFQIPSANGLCGCAE